MAKQRKTWMLGPGKAVEASLPGTLKDEVDTKAKELVENTLKPKHVEPPGNQQHNFLTDITTKWLGTKMYFISTYRCPAPNAMSPSFETKFARMEYVGNASFALSFMRHTGKWVARYNRLSIDQCLKAIQDDPWFAP